MLVYQENMSDKRVVMKFESLPNEIVIECFEYLNAVEIFHSFDLLNSRFYNLIRNIPLYLNVEEIEESHLVQFCHKMLSNPQIKNQIRSVKLSYNRTFNGVQIILSYVSLNDFPHLRSLVLSHLTNIKDMRQVSPMLSLLTNLRYFRLEIYCCHESRTLLASLPASTIQTLSIWTVFYNLPPPNSYTSLTNLTVFSHCIKQLCGLLKCSPVLKNLTIEFLKYFINSSIISHRPLSPNDQTTSLKRLIIKGFYYEFYALETLLQRTPYLEHLVVFSYDNLDIADALRWESLISTSLSLLDIFKFHFQFDIEDKDRDIVDAFQMFQTDFWHQQHRWHVEYVVCNNRALLYTVPYISNEYQIRADMKRYYNKSINSAKTFAKVTDLTLYIDAMTNGDEYYFPYVKSLKFNVRSDVNDNYQFLKMKHIECLRMMVDLCNLTHLEISSECRWKSSSVMLQLLRDAAHLSSLKITKNTLSLMYNKRDLCEYLNKIIKRLNITDSDSRTYLDSIEMEKVCEIFSNMKTFQSDIGLPDHLKMILNQLSKLTYIKSFSYQSHCYTSDYRWLENHKSELDSYPFSVKCEITYNFLDVDDLLLSEPF